MKQTTDKSPMKMTSYTNFNTFSKKLNTFSKFVTIFLLSLIFTNGAMTGRIIYSNIMYHNFSRQRRYT